MLSLELLSNSIVADLQQLTPRLIVYQFMFSLVHKTFFLISRSNAASVPVVKIPFNAIAQRLEAELCLRYWLS